MLISHLWYTIKITEALAFDKKKNWAHKKKRQYTSSSYFLIGGYLKRCHKLLTAILLKYEWLYWQQLTALNFRNNGLYSNHLVKEMGSNLIQSVLCFWKWSFWIPFFFTIKWHYLNTTFQQKYYNTHVAS